MDADRQLQRLWRLSASICSHTVRCIWLKESHASTAPVSAGGASRLLDMGVGKLKPPDSSLPAVTDAQVPTEAQRASSEMLLQPHPDLGFNIIRAAFDLLDLNTVHEQPCCPTEEFQRLQPGCI
jgi:hypothetical protein